MRYRHVLALNPYFGYGADARELFPPTGLEYIATAMKGLVGKVTLLDLAHEKAYQDPATLSRFIRSEIDLLCVTVGWRSRFERICNFVAQLPDEVPTIVGGQQATQEVESIFERCPNVDMIVRGEGEEIIKQLVAGVPCEEIRGLSFRRDGRLVHNENAVLPDLSRLAYPDRSLRRCEYGSNYCGVRLTRHKFDTILTARGCPFQCKFCTFSINPFGQKRSYTERPVESVIEELKSITADVVLFSDDNFATNPARAEQLCDLIISSGIRKTMVVQARIDIARHRRLLDKAWQAGFRVLLIGIESPHDRILDQLHKGITQQQVREAFAVLTQYDFHLHGYFIYGNVGETEEEMLYIPTFAREIGLDSISFQKLRIERFSPLKELVESTPGYYYERIGGHVFSDRYGSRELKRIRNRIRSRFYTPRQLLKIAAKARRIGLVNAQDIAGMVLRLPLLAHAQISRRLQKSKSRRHAPSTRARIEQPTGTPV
ncbi:MAG: B12-binding domain-containing radical SAM protein [Solirubrobacterales bacterium]